MIWLNCECHWPLFFFHGFWSRIQNHFIRKKFDCSFELTGELNWKHNTILNGPTATNQLFQIKCQIKWFSIRLSDFSYVPTWNSLSFSFNLRLNSNFYFLHRNTFREGLDMDTRWHVFLRTHKLTFSQST